MLTVDQNLQAWSLTTGQTGHGIPPTLGEFSNQISTKHAANSSREQRVGERKVLISLLGVFAVPQWLFRPGLRASTPALSTHRAGFPVRVLPLFKLSGAGSWRWGWPAEHKLAAAFCCPGNGKGRIHPVLLSPGLCLYSRLMHVLGDKHFHGTAEENQSFPTLLQLSGVKWCWGAVSWKRVKEGCQESFITMSYWC